MKLDRIILILLISLLTACSSTNKAVNVNMSEDPTKQYKFTRSHLGVVLGGATGVGACVELIGTDPYVAATCAVIGAFVGAEIMHNSDYDLHQAVFVDHLNKDQDKAVDERKMDLRQKDLDRFMESAIGQKPKEQTWIRLM